MRHKVAGFFSLEVALTIAVFLPFALCTFDTVRYLISHTILTRALTTAAKSAEKENLTSRQIASVIVRDTAPLLPIEGYACSANISESGVCCEESEPKCLGVYLSADPSSPVILVRYKVHYIMLDTLLGGPDTSPLLQGVLVVSQPVWSSTALPASSRIENGIVDD